MNIFELEQILSNWAPKSFAENFDNVGLLLGNPQQKITGVLVCLDCTEQVINEAIQLNYNTIVCFHPIIFSGLKSITGKNYVEKITLKAIKNDLNIIAIHTNLDAIKTGVNAEICRKLNIKQTKVLIPKQDILYKLSCYVPKEYLQKVQNSLFDAGAGNYADYHKCSYFFNGTGMFTPKTGSQPFIGKENITETTQEICLNVLIDQSNKNTVLEALFKNHPYEQPGYELIKLENPHDDIGMGRIGYLENPMNEIDFFDQIKDIFNVKIIKHSQFLNKKIQKIAVLGGSGSFAISDAIHQKADLFITADLKYHDFFKAENKILLADIGHYESEQFTKNIIFKYIIEHITKKSLTFACKISDINTNPVNYF